MVLYGGMDLHGDNVFCTLMGRDYKPVYEQRLPNDLPTVLAALAPYRAQVAGVAVESTYNWYWLVDGLQANQYSTRLANPARMQENIGLKRKRQDRCAVSGQANGDGRVAGRLHLS